MARRGVYKGSTNGSAPILKVMPVNASQAIKAGSVVVLSGGKLSVAAAAAAAGTVVGVAYQDYTSGGTVTDADEIKVDVNPASIYEFPYSGTTKTSLTESDKGTVFDLGANAYTVNLDDTTGGYFLCQGYNNTRKTIDALLLHRVQNS